MKIPMNKLKLTLIIALTGMIAISCSDDDTAPPQAGSNFVLSLVTDAANGAGLLIATDAIPTSAVNPENGGFAMSQIRTTGYAYKDAIYKTITKAITGIRTSAPRPSRFLIRPPWNEREILTYLQ